MDSKGPRPLPRGWFSIGFSHEFARGQVVNRKLAGREMVVYRTESGELRAMDPVCPHLGAHFGHGGKVVGETIRCPFHAFRFDGEGACVATGYATKPPRARAKMRATIERHGIALVWNDPTDGPPLWEIPTLDTTGWSELTTHCFKLRGHPQDTTENSVDIGHFTVVHGYSEVRQLKPLVMDGPYLSARYGMARPLEILGRSSLFGKTAMIDAEFELHVHGLGYSFVEVKVKSGGLETRNFVLSTPVDHGDLELRIAMSLRHVDQTPSAHPLLRAIPRRLAEPLFRQQAFNAYRHDVEQDFDIWNNMTVIPQPALAQGDGPIIQYRKWATQFYPQIPPPKDPTLVPRESLVRES